MSKATAFALYLASIALLAAPSQVIAAQTAPSSATPKQQASTGTDTKPKLTCRIHMEGNTPRRVCLTKEQWQEVDAGRIDATSETYIDRFGRCGIRDTAAVSGALGAC